MAGWLVAQIHPCCPSPETRHSMEMALMRQLQFLHRTAVRLSPSADSPDRKLESSLFHTEVNWPMGFHVLVLAVGPDRICAHKPSFSRECGSTNRPSLFCIRKTTITSPMYLLQMKARGQKAMLQNSLGLHFDCCSEWHSLGLFKDSKWDVACDSLNLFLSFSN